LPTDAAHDVLSRLVGDRASSFAFQQIESDHDKDVYEIEAHGGHVTIRGNTPVSMSRGAYAYLREACHCMFGWEGKYIDLPATLPDFPKTRVVSPYQLRQDYNVCTFGYTTAFWDWPQWERELDWMALHGVNMPLASVATEAIWQRVWLDEGLTQEELDHYFTGPAFYPWHRMGNVNGWDGPAPKSFFAKQVALQKKIIARMRELGMQPIAPAFAGFVPPEFVRVHPDAKLQHLKAWGGFDVPYRTHLLDPTSPLYPKIGRKFNQEWEKEFGPAKYFLADSFNELEVSVPPDRDERLATLAAYGDAVYQSIIAGEPDAVWVMQGWLFYNRRKFWDKESAAAMLSKVPDDRMIILDLACDFTPMWKEHSDANGAFYGKQWIYSVIHNMGGKSSLGGSLDFFAADSANTLAATNHGKLVGSGLAMEGIENNEVIYELITDGMWSDKPINLDDWLPKFCTSRYGACPDEMKQAWQLLRKTCYAKPAAHTRPGYQYRPTTQPAGKNPSDDSPEYLQAVKLFLSCGDSLGKADLYRADAIELTAQYLGSRADEQIKLAMAAHGAGNSAECSKHADAALAILDEIDTLLAAHPINRLDRWIGFARAWGDSSAEADYFEADAKRQITTWGGPSLSEYASKVWSGLTRDYYRARWEQYFKSLQTGEPFDMKQWEEKWITTPTRAQSSPKIDNVIEQCRKYIDDNPRPSG
jgi:alpha-N-acetylglucosaminidase